MAVGATILSNTSKEWMLKWASENRRATSFEPIVLRAKMSFSGSARYETATDTLGKQLEQ